MRIYNYIALEERFSMKHGWRKALPLYLICLYHYQVFIFSKISASASEQLKCRLKVDALVDVILKKFIFSFDKKNFFVNKLDMKILLRLSLKNK